MKTEYSCSYQISLVEGDSVSTRRKDADYGKQFRLRAWKNQFLYCWQDGKGQLKLDLDLKLFERQRDLFGKGRLRVYLEECYVKSRDKESVLMTERPYPFQTTSIDALREAQLSIKQAFQLGAYTFDEALAYHFDVIAQVMMCRLEAGLDLPVLKEYSACVYHLNRLYALPPYVRAAK